MEIANIVNLTPHNVNLYVSDDVVVTIPPAPNARPVRVSDAQTLLTGGQWDGPVPIVRVTAGEVANLPAPRKGVWLIVSRIVAQALPQRSDLLAPYQEVRDENNQIVGCRALATFANEVIA
jgi:hypothetical protein